MPFMVGGTVVPLGLGGGQGFLRSRIKSLFIRLLRASVISGGRRLVSSAMAVLGDVVLVDGGRFVVMFLRARGPVGGLKGWVRVT